MPYFLKQWGSRPVVNYYDEPMRQNYDENGWDWPEPIDWSIAIDGQPMPNARVRLKLKDSHGGEWDEWSEDLRVREFPKGVAS